MCEKQTKQKTSPYHIRLVGKYALNHFVLLYTFLFHSLVTFRIPFWQHSLHDVCCVFLQTSGFEGILDQPFNDGWRCFLGLLIPFLCHLWPWLWFVWFFNFVVLEKSLNPPGLIYNDKREDGLQWRRERWISFSHSRGNWLKTSPKRGTGEKCGVFATCWHEILEFLPHD